MQRAAPFLFKFILITNLAIVSIGYFLPGIYPFQDALLYSTMGFISIAFFLFFANRLNFLKNQGLLASNPFFTNQWIIENIPNVFCIKDPQGRWLEASPVYLNLLGLNGIDYKGKQNQELSLLSIDIEKAAKINALNDEQIWNLGRSMTGIETYASPDLNIQTIEITRTPVYDNQNQPYLLIISGTNLTPSTQKLRELKLTSTVFNHNPQSIMIIDADFMIQRINHSFVKLTGFKTEKIKGNSISMISAQDDNEIMFTTIQKFIEKNRQQWRGGISCRRLDGTCFPANLTLSPVWDKSDNRLKHYIGILADITHDKANEREIMRLAHYDDLTNLPNRVMFIKRLNQNLSRAKRHSLNTALLFIDLDHFKSINDTIGHQGGDELLRESAKRLVKTVRQEDTVARLSGDEFAILLDDHKNYEQASYAATLISNKVITTLSDSFYIQNRELFIGASIGIAIFPEDGRTAQDLLKHADIAMYQAKNQGRNNYHFFKQNYIVALNDRNQLELDLRKALTNNDFHLLYQPQYDSESREIIGAEALVRWRINETKVVSPYYFIPLAEETGLIVPLGKWILKTACKQLKEWLDAGYPINKVSVNISSRQFNEPDFLQMVEDSLNSTGLNPRNLELEITESMLMYDLNRVILQLQRLHDMGISLAIDDFGTGYSSLSYLKDFPIDILKIDQSFVKDIPQNSKDNKIVCAIIEMGHSLGLKTVAEGVETEAHFKFLKQQKCDYIQGYLFNPPLSSQDLASLLEK